MVRRMIFASLVGLLTVGCRPAEEQAMTAIAAPEINALEIDPPAIDAVELDATVAAPSPSDNPPATDVAAAAADEFDPPFPGRTELFAPPRRGPSTIRRDDEHGGSIELKGFVNVDGPRAVLSIDGVLSPIPAGGEKYGVQVISINPPQAVLQRGRNRWTASVE
jgi:hypothetical protein